MLVIQFVMVQCLEDHAHMVPVLLTGRAPHHESMYTDTKTPIMEGAGRAAGSACRGRPAESKHRTGQDRTGEDGSHIVLEQGGHVVKAKHSHLKFILPARDPKAGLVSIVLCYQKLV